VRSKADASPRHVILDEYDARERIALPCLTIASGSRLVDSAVRCKRKTGEYRSS
jgi:hypothetical protein